MTVYRASAIPDEVTRSALPADLTSWLKEAPKLGEHAPVHEQRVAHDKLIPRNPPPIGRVEHLGLAGPYGTLTVRCTTHPRPGRPAGQR